MGVPAALLSACLGAVGLLGLPAAAAPAAETTYRVHVLPDPTQGHSPYGACGAAEGYVVGADVGDNVSRFSVRRGETLAVELAPDLNVFAGDVGLQWSLRLLDARSRELARSAAGPAWRHPTVARKFASAQQVWVVACNSNGFPDATVRVVRS
jgi:hypothetical protein